MQRIITEPADLVGRWFVVRDDDDDDPDVKFYDDAEFASAKLVAKREARDPALALRGRLIVAGIDEYRVGDALTLADRETVDTEFARGAGTLWRNLLFAVLLIGSNILFDVLGQPLRTGLPWWQGALNTLLVSASLLLVLCAVFRRLTRDPDSRTTRALAGHFKRESLDAHRAELEG